MKSLHVHHSNVRSTEFRAQVTHFNLWHTTVTTIFEKVFAQSGISQKLKGHSELSVI